MRIKNQQYPAIWLNEQGVVQIIDQRFLPFQFTIADLNTVEDAYTAIKDMHVRGAGTIGVCAGFGMYLGIKNANENNADKQFQKTAAYLKSSRPTAVDLEWAVEKQLSAYIPTVSYQEKCQIALQMANNIMYEWINNCHDIGEHGLKLIREIQKTKPNSQINILTHCNAGWLATVDYGTATAPIYLAHDHGIDIHVWVDETRPRNQGARLTAWELQQHGISHTVIPDNTGGHLMQTGEVDMVIVGSDRTTVNGDVANKIGTYLKALAAYDNHIPFYAAMPSSTIDWQMENGLENIPIETRHHSEVTHISGWSEEHNQEMEVQLMPENSRACNYGFDVTPARLVTGIITERGVCAANKESLLDLYPEKNA